MRYPVGLLETGIITLRRQIENLKIERLFNIVLHR